MELRTQWETLRTRTTGPTKVSNSIAILWLLSLAGSALAGTVLMDRPGQTWVMDPVNRTPAYCKLTQLRPKNRAETTCYTVKVTSGGVGSMETPPQRLTIDDADPNLVDENFLRAGRTNLVIPYLTEDKVIQLLRKIESDDPDRYAQMIRVDPAQFPNMLSPTWTYEVIFKSGSACQYDEDPNPQTEIDQDDRAVCPPVPFPSEPADIRSPPERNLSPGGGAFRNRIYMIREHPDGQDAEEGSLSDPQQSVASDNTSPDTMSGDRSPDSQMRDRGRSVDSDPLTQRSNSFDPQAFGSLDGSIDVDTSRSGGQKRPSPTRDDLPTTPTYPVQSQFPSPRRPRERDAAEHDADGHTTLRRSARHDGLYQMLGWMFTEQSCVGRADRSERRYRR